MKTRNYLAIVVLCIGFLQMTGYLCGSKFLRGLGLASGISPFPKVFCEAEGYEAFAASFELVAVDSEGRPWSRGLSPELYSNLEGPYNRRNVYGASLAFAPRLPSALRDQVLEQALDPDSQLRRELGIPHELVDMRVIITSRDGTTQWTYP